MAHEYLSPLQPAYKECKCCDKRTESICTKCGYCYECHPEIEEMERRTVVTMPGNLRSLTDIESS